MIIHINGVQGSGKSYICNRLKKNKKVICIDTDDIQLQAYKNIRNKSSYKKELHDIKGFEKQDPFPTLTKEMQKIYKSIIRKHKNKILIISGMAFEVKYYDMGYFIKLDKLPEIYKRTLLRDFDKIFSNKNKIKNIIKTTEDPYFVKEELDFPLNLGGLDPYIIYKMRYDDMLKQAKTDNYKILSSDKIYKDIMKLIS
jgi:hypothetical protein|tara:strand:+ start:49 stop:642 length:594 start_codon:yes stop_codon:yes gene_type:complete